MILAVAGLDDLALTERTKKLASGDWSTFKSADRACLFLARKLTLTPWQVGKDDIKTLASHLGPERTLDALWYLCWCNYMTRVADAFQIPLEPDNVFQNPKPKPDK